MPSTASTSPCSRAGGDTSKALAPEAARRGATVIDNSSAWRMDPAVPLVVSQVNPDDLRWHEGIIANPNCSTMQLVPVLMALRDAVGIERVVVDTYQAVSGSGGRLSRSCRGRSRRTSPTGRLEATVYPHQIAFNALPAGRRLPRQRLHEGGVEGRHGEPQDPPPAGPAHLVHGRAHPGVRRAIPRPSTSRRATRSRRTGRGRCSRPCPASSSRTTRRPSTYPLATEAAGTDEIYVGRVRQDQSVDGGRGLAFWVVSDNLRKGAATNAVQLAEVLVERGWVQAAATRDAAGSPA